MESQLPEIREFYNGYTAPKSAYSTVRVLLHSVPLKYLRGLDCVVLTNQSGHPRRFRIGKIKSRKWRFPQSQVVGRYHHANREHLAWIELFIDKIHEAGGNAWFPFLRQAVYGYVLFHEIGHHIHATVAPEHREKEDVADEWRGKLLGNFMKNRYWYLLPVRRPLVAIMRAWVRGL